MSQDDAAFAAALDRLAQLTQLPVSAEETSQTELDICTIAGYMVDKHFTRNQVDEYLSSFIEELKVKVNNKIREYDQENEMTDFYVLPDDTEEAKQRDNPPLRV